MRSKLIVMADLHARKEEPFFLAQKEFCNWFIKQDFNNEDNYLIDLGDLTDSSSPNPDVYDMLINFYNQLKFRSKYILAGNHCYNRLKNSFAEQPMSNIKNTEIIYKPKILEIEKLCCLCMPFLYDKTFFDQTMKEFYEDKNNFPKKDYDFLFYHFQDSTIKFTKDDDAGINIDYLNGIKLGGHIHSFQKNYLGSVLINRYDERNKDSFIAIIDLKTKEIEYIKVPQFIDYWQINYEDDFIKPKEFYRIFDILNAPSIDIAKEKFKNCYLHEIFLKKDKNSNDIIENESNERLTIKDYLSNFFEKNKYNKKIRDKVIEKIN